MGKKISEKEKLCIIAWDEMAIKKGLSYNKSTDSIYGFETSFIYTENRQLASYALVFMARGITKSWKQVLGYFFTAKSSAINVAGLVNQAISILMSCDFEVVSTVCDQGPSNLGIYRDLGATTENPFFYHNGRKMFTVHDPPHLMKCTRNNLLNHGVYFKNVKSKPKTGDAPLPVLFAEWQHIVDLYKADSEKTYRSCPKLTAKHVTVPGFSKLNGKLAAQVCIVKSKDPYKEWLSSTNNKHKAKCHLCNKEFDIGRMGESAVKVHMKGLKHISLMEGKKTGSIVSFCKSTKPAAEEPIPKQDSGLASYTTGKGALDAEILWAIKCVLSHFSYNSCQGNAELFSRMFPDSTIAKQFALGERKCSYLISFGLAPHIKSMLLKSLGDADFFTILFDETLNKSNQRKQMDIHLRFWDSSENQVKTKYFDSAFMGHSTAGDLLKEFYTIVKSLNLSKLLQISMDGPSVNWSFYNALQKDLEKEFNCVSANIGTCGLHILNNAFRKGALDADWNISSVLVSLFWLFKDSPARREDFLELSVLKKLPTKFCTYRWLENVPAAEKAVLIWEDVKSFVKSIERGILQKSIISPLMLLLKLRKTSCLC
ncbi:hypothetical protein JTE90_019416 [Oedothorax gibbosus]|uniref:Transposable element P transposase-like RNase H domain-containing protein n=1 Tax=Oedothorax gibbosus TaxID=931172 RepID=A0AAV6TV47_9ARAC|nr:hypothetical protein JTE90_019416 [Oedothorax gibbosus]